MGAVFGALGMKILEVLLPSLATLIGGLVSALLAKQLRKAGLDLDEKQQAALRQIIEDAIKAAEEAARRNPTMTSEEKRSIAASIVAAKVPKLNQVDVSLALDAALPEVRAQLGETRKLPRPSLAGYAPAIKRAD